MLGSYFVLHVVGLNKVSFAGVLLNKREAKRIQTNEEKKKEIPREKHKIKRGGEKIRDMCLEVVQLQISSSQKWKPTGGVTILMSNSISIIWNSPVLHPPQWSGL